MINSQNRKLSVIPWFCLLEATINISGEAWLAFLGSPTHITQLKFLTMNNRPNPPPSGFSEFKAASTPFKSTPLARFIMPFAEFETSILFLSTNKILVYTAVSSCIRFMPRCIFHRSIPTHLIALTSLNESCFTRKKFSSIGCIFLCFEISCFETAIFIS